MFCELSLLLSVSPKGVWMPSNGAAGIPSSHVHRQQEHY